MTKLLFIDVIKTTTEMNESWEDQADEYPI